MALKFLDGKLTPLDLLKKLDDKRTCHIWRIQRNNAWIQWYHRWL